MLLDDEYKIKTAKVFTELAIQNGLIARKNFSSETAMDVCTFFKTVVEKLDDTGKNQSNK